ncbi:type II secretion system protein GspM [Marinibactrum halimedae]|uniref:Type II secretion system protein M n=1 Tax=Marinibactrum halimedae TaxID=1444977 RepID=A0AA37WPD1_9GAMM|nr:type II secretion system protein M [Marinibactrum halimedae]MCD9458262.1 type II secretion system protein M [Marinibactrum halimedae]GLS27111.1 hypothetical protein GCM10007877_28300 [Marinibactrum halimedae]
MMESINQQWQALSRRDQTALLVCSVALILAVIWWMILQPMSKAVDQQAISTRASADNLARVREMALELKQYQASGSSQSSGSNAPLSELIDRSLQTRGLKMSSFQPVKDGEVRLRIDDAEYTKFVQWLYDMEQQQKLTARELTVTPTRASGKVSVSIRLAR